MEAAEDVIATLNWMLHHGDAVSAANVTAWQQQRASALGV